MGNRRRKGNKRLEGRQMTNVPVPQFCFGHLVFGVQQTKIVLKCNKLLPRDL